MGFFQDIGNVLSAPVNFIGDVLSGGAVSNTQDIKDTNVANAQQAQKQMDFQERMANTSYQRGMEDMRQAGLNPLLAFQNGGASVPTGAAATMQSPQSGSIGAGIANTAKSVFGLSLDKQKTQAEVGNLNQSTNLDTQRVFTESSLASKYDAEAERARLEAQNKAMEQPVVAAQAALDLKNIKTDAKYQGEDQLIKRVGSAAGAIGSAFKAVNPVGSIIDSISGRVKNSAGASPNYRPNPPSSMQKALREQMSPYNQPRPRR